MTAEGEAPGSTPTLRNRYVSARNWLDRVRDGNLDPAASARLLRLVYTVWLVALLLKGLGSAWDVSWHFKWLRDDFAPPHDVNLVGDGIVILLVIFHYYTRFGIDRVGLRLMQTGIVLFLLSAPLDVINHEINGLDITTWSITHFGLYTGTAIMTTGVIRGWLKFGRADARFTLILYWAWFFFVENLLFPNQHQEYGVLAIAAWDRGTPEQEPSLLAFAANQIGHPVDRSTVVQFGLPIPPWVYPMWILGVIMVVLLVARRSIGLRWTATMLATTYVVWRCAMWGLLAAIGFTLSAVPFALITGGLAIDLVAMLALAWPVEAVLGAIATTTAIYAGLWIQSEVLVAPPVSYWSAPVAAVVLALGWATVRLVWQRYTALRIPAQRSP